MKMPRLSGVLLHISSLPGEYSIGSFGAEAKRFVDFLAAAGFGYWQTLPLCMTDGYNSPYSSPGTFSLNPYFVDLPGLRDDGLLSTAELLAAKQRAPYSCEFARLGKERIALLLTAAARIDGATRACVDKTMSENPQIALFCDYIAKQRGESADGWRFIEHAALLQWSKIKRYANEKGVRIIGDIPIYVNLNSSDVANHPSLFELDTEGRPERVAGVPPDYFSADGQKWGNPLYNWSGVGDGVPDVPSGELDRWWGQRIRAAFDLFDGVRIDHFRGLSDFWAVPADAKTAKDGKWERGPGFPFVKMLIKEAESAGGFIIAEDLGELDGRARELVEDSALPGMRVLQFAFLSQDNLHMPHNHVKNSVAYTGTHDNNTLLGYLWESNEGTRKYTLDYIGYTGDWRQATEALIRSGMRSVADTFILPIQDILGFGGDTRMNRPGTSVAENWAYRVDSGQLAGIDAAKWRSMNQMYGRMGSKL